MALDEDDNDEVAVWIDRLQIALTLAHRCSAKARERKSVCACVRRRSAQCTVHKRAQFTRTVHLQTHLFSHVREHACERASQQAQRLALTLRTPCICSSIPAQSYWGHRQTIYGLEGGCRRSRCCAHIAISELVSTCAARVKLVAHVARVRWQVQQVNFVRINVGDAFGKRLLPLPMLVERWSFARFRPRLQVYICKRTRR